MGDSPRFRMGRLDHLHEYDRIAAELIDADGIAPTRYWPRQVFDDYSG